jgi:hypothetical protein
MIFSLKEKDEAAAPGAPVDDQTRRRAPDPFRPRMKPSFYSVFLEKNDPRRRTGH